MRLVAFPADSTGCGQYRVFLPAVAASEAHGVEARFSKGLEVALRASEGGREVRACAAVDADVALFQRPLSDLVVGAIPHLQAQGTAVVVEVDDDFSAVDPRHAAYAAFHPRTSPRSNFRLLARACRLADMVTVSTPALAARYGGHGRVAVLPNCVPGGLLLYRAERDGRTCGWSGFAGAHPGDLERARGVQDALSDCGWRFRVVGGGEGVRRALALRDEPEATGSLDIELYAARVAELDAAIAPLAPTRFNEAKSNLKGLEYAALGVPFVASPLPEYGRLAAEGVGRLAARPREWRRELGRLFSDAAAREEAAARGRAAVAARHTVEGEAWRWAEAWQEAIDRRRRVGRRAA